MTEGRRHQQTRVYELLVTDMIDIPNSNRFSMKFDGNVRNE